MKKRNPPNPAKGCASELYDLQSNRSEKGGVVRAGEKVRLNYEKKAFIVQFGKIVLHFAEKLCTRSKRLKN